MSYSPALPAPLTLALFFSALSALVLYPYAVPVALPFCWFSLCAPSDRTFPEPPVCLQLGFIFFFKLNSDINVKDNLTHTRWPGLISVSAGVSIRTGCRRRGSKVKEHSLLFTPLPLLLPSCHHSSPFIPHFIHPLTHHTLTHSSSLSSTEQPSLRLFSPFPSVCGFFPIILCSGRCLQPLFVLRCVSRVTLPRCELSAAGLAHKHTRAALFCTFSPVTKTTVASFINHAK